MQENRLKGCNHKIKQASYSDNCAYKKPAVEMFTSYEVESKGFSHLEMFPVI